jgi:CofD-related protein of GAK system
MAPKPPVQVRLSTTRTLPDPVLAERCKKSPELGPNILFFSGGTALRGLSRSLTAYTHNSVHLITPFDSGGSSAKLRQAFGMPAVGDIRNRLMALADAGLHGNPEISRLFTHRLDKQGNPAALRAELEALAHGEHPLVAAIPDPMRKIIRAHFYDFLTAAPGNFDLRGASLGNLVLAGGYLSNRRHLDPVIYLFSMLVRVLGVVRPVVNEDLHLAAELEDGMVLAGQHRLTGKEEAPLSSPIRRLWLVDSLDHPTPRQTAIRPKVAELIRQAGLICFPMGSFHTSLCACLLPEGVGREVARAGCPKVFVPSTGQDPELVGQGLEEQLLALTGLLARDCGGEVALDRLLNLVLLDPEHGPRADAALRQRWAARGVRVLDCPLASENSAPHLDPELLAPVLVSLT